LFYTSCSRSEEELGLRAWSASLAAEAGSFVHPLRKKILPFPGEGHTRRRRRRRRRKEGGGTDAWSVLAAHR